MSFSAVFRQFITIIIILIWSAPLQAQQWQQVYSDRHTLSIDTTTLKGKKYITYLRGADFFLLNAAGDTLARKSGNYYETEFSDFNKDGFKDILVHSSGSAGMTIDLFLYLPQTARFKEVQDMGLFPAAEAVNGAKNYYYSYRKSGCGDMNWDSDLVLVADFKAQKIGTISGRQCNNRDMQDGVYIYKVVNGKAALGKILPVATIWQFKDARWGFLKDYWSKNYQLFRPAGSGK